MRACRLAIALALLAAPAAAQEAAPVIAAERAFAARAAEVGVAQSFLDFMTAEAIVFAPEPVNAKALYSSQPPGRAPKDGGPTLAWWPNWAGIARSGDLGFTTGPAEVNGKRTVNYFTVWKKQPDGAWKWVYDGGASDATGGSPAAAPVAQLGPGDPRPLDIRQAFAQVDAAETLLATRAARAAVPAYRSVLAPDAHMQGSPRRPATTPAEIAEELATRAPAIQFKHLGGEVSDAGDLAWTFGSAGWTKAGVPGRGHYVRIWQRRAGQWKLVFDQLLDAPPPKPQA